MDKNVIAELFNDAICNDDTFSDPKWEGLLNTNPNFDINAVDWKLCRNADAMKFFLNLPGVRVEDIDLSEINDEGVMDVLVNDTRINLSAELRNCMLQNNWEMVARLLTSPRFTISDDDILFVNELPETPAFRKGGCGTCDNRPCKRKLAVSLVVDFLADPQSAKADCLLLMKSK